MSFFHFPGEEERRRRRQAKGHDNFVAGDTLKLSDYGYPWKRTPLPSSTSYDTGAFGIVFTLPENWGKKETQINLFVGAERHLHSVTYINNLDRVRRH
jgi:hypothetical protein